MGILHDDVVLVTQPERQEDPTIITVNCPDKTGLGCDLCRIILFFGLNIVRGDVSTDGKWCYIVFWVVGAGEVRWSLLKKRLIEACPSCSSASGISFYSTELQQKVPDVFLLKLCCFDRTGLLHGSLIRDLLHTRERREETYDYLKAAIGEAMISCEIEMVGPEITACSQESSFLPNSITDDLLQLELAAAAAEVPTSLTSTDVSVNMDNSLSPGHTLVQIMCQDHKGLLYDIMRTLKDCGIQISYGRFSTKQGKNCEIDLFIVQTNGNKIVDPSKQKGLASRLESELRRPLRVALVSRGPDTELIVANPVELSGKGRPLVLYDITLALKLLDTCIFLAEIRRRMIGDREFEVYRVLLDEGEGLSVPIRRIEEGVWRMLMGWE
ncbi:ACT domain-containing protein ACR10 [Linum perenne]